MKFYYTTPKAFVTLKSELEDILKNDIKKSYITPVWNGNELLLKIEKVGTSKIYFEFAEMGDKSTTIKEKKREIAMMHKPFASEVEKMVDSILVDKMGAKRIEV